MARIALVATLIAVPAFAPASPGTTADGAAAPGFAVSLQRNLETATLADLSVADVFRDKSLYIKAVTNKAGQTRYAILLGFFATELQARQSLHLLTRHYPQAWVVPVSAAEAHQVDDALRAAPAAKRDGVVAAAAVGSDAAAPPAQNDDREKQRAIALFRTLAANGNARQQKIAQELLVTTLAADGQADAARAEFVAYRQRYPDDAGTARIMQRLAQWAPEPDPLTVADSEPALAPTPVAAPPEPDAPPAAHGVGNFAVQLALSDDAPAHDRIVLPDGFSGRLLYADKTTVAGRAQYRLRLGFFETRVAAEQTLDLLSRQYPQAWVVRVAERERQHAWRDGSPVTARAPDATAIARASGGADAPAPAEPQHDPVAQELRGLMLAYQGQTDAARQEYRQYLAQFAGSPGAARVSKYLAQLDGTPAAATNRATPALALDRSRTLDYPRLIEQLLLAADDEEWFASGVDPEPDSALALAAVDRAGVSAGVVRNGDGAPPSYAPYAANQPASVKASFAMTDAVSLRTSYEQKYPDPKTTRQPRYLSDYDGYWGISVESGAGGGRPATYAEMAYSAFDPHTGEHFGDAARRLMRFGAQNAWGDMTYGLDHRSVGSSFISGRFVRPGGLARGRDVDELWSYRKFGGAGLRTFIIRSEDQPGFGNYRDLEAGGTLDYTIASWPYVGYALTLADGARRHASAAAAEFSRTTSNLYFSAARMSGSLYSEYVAGADDWATPTITTHWLDWSYYPHERLVISPSLGYIVEKYTVANTVTAKQSASLTLTYRPAGSRYSFLTYASYETETNDDWYLHYDYTYAQTGVEMPYESSLFGPGTLALFVAYDRFTNEFYPETGLSDVALWLKLDRFSSF